MSGNAPKGSKASKSAEGKLQHRSSSRERSQQQPQNSRNDKQETAPASENRATRNQIDKVTKKLAANINDNGPKSAEERAVLRKTLDNLESIRPR
ncbi:uncharacterized protein EAF01_010925 [Botrytis porri]|uniref:Uncharacterized protein n=1 Tax=Botrytis porri TaxID=87229 RepID=A0A4Z1K8V0_9HELO|nr:uncharacterized protein EAF01_010925 [Botrytis porri]KAF7889432.1 hypothetical protein EAF01_010925 [Botrytis porri]TGO82080.1 hypothetical protein BPOR_0927g00030 [Botrytis porri]